MEGQRSWKHWLNPIYGSETNSTAFSSKSAPEKLTSSKEKDMHRLIQCISQSWKTMKSMPSTSSFGSRNEKEVIVEGYIPTTKQSLLNFLKGMGLKPRVEVVGKETLITADASQIRDTALKLRFINFLKKQVASALETVDDSSTTLASSAASKPTSAASGKSEKSSEPSKDSSKQSELSSEPSLGHTKKGRVWTLPKYLSNDDDFDKGKSKKKSMNKDMTSTGKMGEDKATKMNVKDNTSKKKEDKKKSVAFKTVGMVPVVGSVENPFARQILIDTHIANNSEDEKLDQLGNVSKLSTGNVKTEADSLVRPQTIQDQPTCHDPQTTIECERPTKNQKKKKKLRILKHLRKLFPKKKDSGPKDSPPVAKDCENYEEGRQDSVISKKSYDLNPMCQFQTVSVAREPDRTPMYEGNKKYQERNRNMDRGDGVPVTAKLFVENHRNQNKKKGGNKLPERMKINDQPFDGSISMPVLITPDQSCFKTKLDLLDASKSSARVGEEVQAKHSYSVVGDKAAIHIGKKRIRLEGKDVKYGSILQKDEDFDKHFRVLRENSLTDIEKQVRKVKERIMFARAMGVVGDRLPEGAPKVNYEELLVPEKVKRQDGSTFDCRSQVNIATTTSFYQKFLASMNILKMTHRFDVCDRSVMTDEPLSKTYAEFINIMDRRNSPRENSSSTENSRQCSKPSLEHVTNGDSSIDLPATSYLKMICTCWEPLFKFFPDHDGNALREHRPPENNRTEEEKILKCIVDKVMDCSRYKKGYIKT